MSWDQDQINRALVSITIEKTLLDLGKPSYDKVVEMLNNDYHCHLPDCYEHPEYLSEVLKVLFGKSSKSIVETIKKQLKDFTYQEHIARFAELISK